MKLSVVCGPLVLHVPHPSFSHRAQDRIRIDGAEQKELVDMSRMAVSFVNVNFSILISINGTI